MTERDRSFQLNQDLEFQRREWAVQRASWWVLTAFVAAAALGLFGDGPLSSARAGRAGAPLWVEYERFVRAGATTRLSVHARTSGRASLELLLPRAYFESFRIEQIVPEPASIAIRPGDVSLQFAVAPGADPLTIVLDLEPLRPGRQRGLFSAGGADVSVSQLVYF
jgi:hypothetical protein